MTGKGSSSDFVQFMHCKPSTRLSIATFFKVIVRASVGNHWPLQEPAQMGKSHSWYSCAGQISLSAWGAQSPAFDSASRFGDDPCQSTDAERAYFLLLCTA